ncbi:MAG: protein kinase [Planctomycetota bacterium]
MNDARSTQQTLPVSMPMETLLATVRTLVGESNFDGAESGQTLRPRSTARLCPSAIPTQLATPSPASTLPTMSSTVSQGASSSSASTLVDDVGSLSRSSEFTLRKRVGKGGMGEVFIAAQNAMRRDVAVKKIIPEHLDKQSAKEIEDTFVSEALVTGFLGHPNIVPVHSLGRDENGHWFFSMKMVQGIEWRHLLHPNSCRDEGTKIKAMVRNLGVDELEFRAAHLEGNLAILLSVCNAVAFAHSKNIIHRDLKPENVMVGEFGEVLVMDWGLAVDVSETPPPIDSPERRVFSRAETGFGGTPSYMAPEQFAFELDGTPTAKALGCATDVFLLGGMLYEILTGEAPYVGTMLNETLRRVAECAPRPIPESVPQELAAICSKALAKDPAERYPNALVFQQAVQDFMTHRQAAVIAAKADQEAKVPEIPNLARAVVLYDQALELWPENAAMARSVHGARATLAVKEHQARRTRFYLNAAAAAIVLGLSIGFFWIRNERQQALAEKARADLNEKTAVAKSKDLAEALAVSAKRGDLLLATLDKQIFDIQDELSKQPGLQDVRKMLLISAAEGYAKALETLPDTSYAQTQTAVALQRLGDVYSNIGDSIQAQAAFRKGLDTTERLLTRTPNDANLRRNVSVIKARLSSVYLQQGDTAMALKLALESRADAEELAAGAPTDLRAQNEWAWAINQVAAIKMRQGDAVFALSEYERAVSILERLAGAQPEIDRAQSDLAWGYTNVGDLLLKRGLMPRALEVYNKALPIFEKLVAKNGESHVNRDNMAIVLERLGDVYNRMSKPDDALKSHMQSLALREKLLVQDPKNANYQRNVSVSHGRLGDVHMSRFDAVSAQASYQKNLTISVAMSSADPKSALFQNDLAWANYKLGDARFAQKDVRGAETYYATAMTMFEKQAINDPTSAQAKRDAAFAADRVGELQMNQGDAENALKTFKSALDYREKLAAMDPDSADALTEVALAYVRVGWVNVSTSNLKEGLGFIEKGLASLKELKRKGVLPVEKHGSIALAEQAIALCKSMMAEQKKPNK